jgi:hypothetical protein
MATVIVSYDGTRNDRDGLALGRLFAAAGASVSLAYVRHATEEDPERERLAGREAERLLEAGAQSLSALQHPTRVVFHPSTADGLTALAAELGADVLAFGSDYRTSPGQVRPGPTAQRLLDGGATAIALAPAGLRREPIETSIGTVSIVDEANDPGVQETAASLAAALGAALTIGDADLTVVGSRLDAPPGRVMISGHAQARLEEATGVVLVLPRQRSIAFAAHDPVAALSGPGALPG